MVVRRRLLGCIAVLCALLLCASCKSKNKNPEKDLVKITQNYVRDELKVEPIDSVRIFQVDTINRYRYITAALGFLQEAEGNLERAIAESAYTGDSTNADGLRAKLDEVGKTCDYYAEHLALYSENDPNILLYFVSAYYYSRGKEEGVMFFLTPDYEIHTFDPMDASFIK